jgi:hypothetical protein
MTGKPTQAPPPIPTVRGRSAPMRDKTPPGYVALDVAAAGRIDELWEKLINGTVTAVYFTDRGPVPVEPERWFKARDAVRRGCLRGSVVRRQWLFIDISQLDKTERRGSKRKYDWDKLHAAIEEKYPEGKGLPKLQKDLEEEALAWCVEEYGKEAGISTIRAQISRYYGGQ